VDILRRQGWWLIPEVLALAVIAVGLIFLRPASLHEQLTARAQQALERLSPAELDLYDMHGHAVSHDSEVICAAESFGAEPASAKRIEEIRVIYAHYLCALVQDGTPWDYASRSSGPAVIVLSAPDTVRIARSGDGYPERVRSLFPEELERRALSGFADLARPSALVVRYREETT
jgi:hypothetical protein